MTVLESCAKHNMVAYLEKTDRNTSFHEIIDFLTRSSIHYALTASIRSDLLFDDADGIDSLPNQAIFDAIKLMGHLDAKKKFVMYTRFISVFLDKQLKNVPVPLDHFSINALTSKNQHETQPDPSPRPSPTIPIPDSIPEGSGGNHGAKIGRKEILEESVDAKASLYPNREETAKLEPTVHKDPAFDDLDDDAMDYIETEDAQDEGRTSSVVLEKKESADKEVSTEVPVSTVKPNKGTDKRNEGKYLEEEAESDAESEGVNEAERKFDQLAKDEEIARKVQEDWEVEEEVKKLVEEEATKVALTNEYDFIQARINADKILVEELQKEEREKFTIEQKAKFLHDTIVAQRKFLAQQRSEAMRNKPPTRNQLRNQMMTYLKHDGGKKHYDLKTKTFEEIQVLYERLKRQDHNFVAIGSAEDERQIKEINEESKDLEKKRLKKRVVNEEDTAKVPAEQEVTEQGTKKRKSGHVKMIARKRPRPQPNDDSDDEHIKCLRIITFESTIDSEIMETKSFIARLHKVSSPDGNYLVVYRVNGHFRAFN
ncbi:hypothetical protein Tco_0734544 [Tanacetum coccineum]